MRLFKPLLLSSLVQSVFTASTSKASDTTNTSAVIYQLSSDTEFAFYLEEVLSLSNGGGAATGEVLRAASQIKPGDIESFAATFTFLADQIHEVATGTKNQVSAREAYFRAASYYRAADFFLHGNLSDPRIYSLWDAQLDDFTKAISLLEVPGKRVTIPAKDFDIPVIFYKATSCNDSTPTILVGSGYDGSQEALYHSIGKEILDRGYNFVTYEGPGQPTVRRQQNIGFIREWWEVVTPVVDYLSTRPDVDMTRLALIGESFGGTLAPLAVAYEDRFIAVLAIDGLYSMEEALDQQLPDELVEFFKSGNETAFNTYIKEAQASPETPTQFRWLIDQGLFAFNTTVPFDWYTRLGQINLEAVIDKIPGPVFVGSGEDDISTLGQPEKLAKLLGDRARYHRFKTNLGAGEHCQLGAEPQLAQAALDWLEDIFRQK